MGHLDGYRIKTRYKGLDGFSEIGFKKHEVRLDDLFPTADELVLSMKAYFYRLDEAAAAPCMRSRCPVWRSRTAGFWSWRCRTRGLRRLIVDVLALMSPMQMMMSDIEKTCGFVRPSLVTPWES
jgi:hypothetical protein